MNNKDFKELIKYLDGKFICIDKKFDRIDERFICIDKKFDRIDERFDDAKQDFVDLQTSVDIYAVKADKYFQEMLMLAHKVDRHEQWLHQIANKLGIKLEY